MVRALTKVGWNAAETIGRGANVRNAAADVDMVVIATPDAAIADVAAAVEPNDECAVVHLSGSLGLDVLAPHRRRAAVHPLVALPDPETGARRLLDHAWFALAAGGDPVGPELVEALDGRAVTVADDPQARALHHAACCVAANYVTTVLAQAERLAAAAGVPFAAYLALARGALDNVADLGAAAALTGPVARSDWTTVERHRASIAATAGDEAALYDALVLATAKLAGQK
jgi:predicted short-subunit dehydrogenase-like oxidoreductase (DUF2520 family)